MPDDRDGSALTEFLSERTPPPMPASQSPAGQPTVLSAPLSAGGRPDAAPPGWTIDRERVSYFTRAVANARDRLREVQQHVERMRTDSFTPKLGTSPAGEQLAKKFADRLDGSLDNERDPTTGGLRPMLAEAMRRMDTFLAGAEAAVKYYQEHDDEAADRVTRAPSG